MREIRAGVTKRVVEALDDTRVHKLLDRYGIDAEQDEKAVHDAMSALPEDQFARLGEDFRRTTEADLHAEVGIQVADEAKRLWDIKMSALDERAATLRNKTIPDAMALYDAGNTPAFEKEMKGIDAEAVSIVTDVHQNRLEVREKLRRFTLETAPHLSRPERNAFVNDIASAEDLVNTALHTPPSAQQAARAVADLKRTISRKDMDADADIDIRMAARRSNDPSP